MGSQPWRAFPAAGSASPVNRTVVGARPTRGAKKLSLEPSPAMPGGSHRQDWEGLNSAEQHSILWMKIECVSWTNRTGQACIRLRARAGGPKPEEPMIWARKKAKSRQAQPVPAPLPRVTRLIRIDSHGYPEGACPATGNITRNVGYTKSRTLPTPSPVASSISSIKRVSQPALIGLLRSSCHRFVLSVGAPVVL